MSSIYGFFAGSHSANVSLIIDGEIINCFEEERFSRIKAGDLSESYPQIASEKIEVVTGLNITDADYKIFAEPFPISYAKKLTKNNFESCSHHEAHCYGAYFTSGFQDKCVVISYDGGGLTSLMRIYLCENGKMTLIRKFLFAEYGSLSHLWGFSTSSIMGYDQYHEGIWKMCKDEGKLMGMSANGRYDEKIYKMLKTCIDYEPGTLMFYPFNTRNRTKFLVDNLFNNGYFETQENKEIFSYNLQKLTEDLFLNFMDDIHKLYPEYKKFCFSGGLFANVKLNQKINNLDWIEEIYIYPPMGDEGLSLGACIYKSVKLGEIEKPKKLKNLFFGTNFDDDEVYEFSKNYNFSRDKYKPEDIAKDLNDGKIIGWFNGKFEHGPRALGARSILVEPTKTETHQLLNSRLRRHDTMPFAPIVLQEFAEEIFDCHKSKYTAEFMTICYNTKDEWIDRIPAVIQKSDKTARPQMVYKDRNPKFWEILKSYYDLTGIPVLLNTSFNAHNEPIIENPSQAFKHLSDGIIDKLVIENYVYFSK